jgi:hypothetical protein
MAQFHDKVGFTIEEDNQLTGIPKRITVEKPYYGRIIEPGRRFQSAENGAEDLILGNRIAITANDFAFRNAFGITHVRYLGCRWKVTAIRIKAPEIILTLGGVYNGPVKT